MRETVVIETAGRASPSHSFRDSVVTEHSHPSATDPLGKTRNSERDREDFQSSDLCIPSYAEQPVAPTRKEWAGAGRVLDARRSISGGGAVSQKKMRPSTTSTAASLAGSPLASAKSNAGGRSSGRHARASERFSLRASSHHSKLCRAW